SDAEEDSLTAPSPAAEEDQQQQTKSRREEGRRRAGGERERSRKSPDGQSSALIKEHNVYLRSEQDGKEYPLTQDGVEGNAYGRLEWAPDSKTLIAWRIEPGDHKEVYLIQSSPAGGGRAKFRSRPYDLPGDQFDRYELSVFEVSSRKQLKPEVDRYEHGWE